MGTIRCVGVFALAAAVVTTAARGDPERDLAAYKGLGEAIDELVGKLGRPKTVEEYEALQRRAVPLYERYLEENGESVFAEKVRWVLHATYVALGEREKAGRVLDDIQEAAIRKLLQVAYARRTIGQRERAGEVLEGLLAAGRDPRVRSLVAQYLHLTGEEERASRIIQECAAKGGDPEAVAFALHVKAELLRGDPRREALLERIVSRYGGTRVARDARRELAALRLEVGSDPLPFEAKDLAGRPISPAALRGKVVLLLFWSTRSAACLKELPAWKVLWQEVRGQGLFIVGVSCDENLRDVEQMVEEEGIGWPQIADGRGWHNAVARLYDVQSLPHTILIGRDGKIAAIGLRGSALRRKVRALLVR